MSKSPRPIHLLYVPTLGCNLGCHYCYLGAQTTPDSLHRDALRAAATLRSALDRFEESGILPFNVSLHGGEVTLLPEAVLDELFTLIRNHYRRHHDAIASLGQRKTDPHIKTNLFRFGELHELFLRHRVSISASIDLPLSLHAKHRVTRSGQPWLERTLENLRLLARYPHVAKISTTISAEHLADLPAFVKDIRFLHEEIGLDMNRFNLMFAFPSKLNGEAHGERVLTPATEDQQVELYETLKREFTGTALEEGLRTHWFDEFTPSYCTNSINCGEKFFLLQGDGSLHSCVRGQGIEGFSYGNILTDPVKDIMDRAAGKIRQAHQGAGLHEDCRACEYLHLCRTGCPVVKQQTGTGKSYTCKLQKALYRDRPMTWPALGDAQAQIDAVRHYARAVHPGLAWELPPPPTPPRTLLLPSDLTGQGNGLQEIVARDPVLGTLYRPSLFQVELDGEFIELESQILKTSVQWHTVVPGTAFRLHLPREILTAHGAEALRNPLHLQLLRDTPVVYGDEARTKQEHLFTYQAWETGLQPSALGEEWAMFDLMPILEIHRKLFRHGVRNNLFVTTTALREHHYAKQKANAFYHIQAINLPFPNLEFFWLDPSNLDPETSSTATETAT
ncbi:MAG: hypothetical protein RL318_1935 [Fibrobacterota bacterium]